MNVSKWIELLKRTFSAFSDDRAMRMGAALAYYSTFSLAPMLFIVTGIAGLVFGAEAARGEIFGQLQGTLGSGAASAVEEMLDSAYQSDGGLLATIVGFVLLAVGASGVFIELQDSLNTIWKVKPRPNQGFIWGFIKNRLLSFSVILGTGFLLLISLILSAALSAMGKWFSTLAIPGGPMVWQAVNLIISVGVVTILFAMIFKILPDVKMKWSDVWIGAAVTAVLFTIGKYLCGLYLGQSSVASAYGAAGTLVVVLLWVYYSALILLFGAEFTRAYAQRHGEQSKPAEHATPATNYPERISA